MLSCRLYKMSRERREDTMLPQITTFTGRDLLSDRWLDVRLCMRDGTFSERATKVDLLIIRFSIFLAHVLAAPVRLLASHARSIE